jgi:hypothetical protein
VKADEIDVCEGIARSIQDDRVGRATQYSLQVDGVAIETDDREADRVRA